MRAGRRAGRRAQPGPRPVPVHDLEAGALIAVRADCTLAFDPAGLEAFLAAQFGGVGARLALLAGELGPEVRAAVGRALAASPEWDSLLSGALRQQFGLADPAAALRAITAAVRAAVRVEAVPPAGDSLGGLFVGAYAADFADALSAEGTSYDSTGGRVDWLKWLLFEGDTVVVPGYWQFSLTRQADASRAGFALMRKIGKVPKEAFRVDPAFAGTAADNWLTRAAAAADPELLALFEAAAQKVLS